MAEDRAGGPPVASAPVTAESAPPSAPLILGAPNADQGIAAGPSSRGTGDGPGVLARRGAPLLNHPADGGMVLAVTSPDGVATGTAWVSGYNYFGQLGNGTFGGQTTEPVTVTGLGDVSLVAGAPGGEQSLAVTADGRAWAWGDNEYGQIGDGTTISRSVPVTISGLSDVASIAGGWRHSLAAKSDGSVWAWGGNGWGELGDGTYNGHATPARVVGPDGTGYLSDVKAVSGGAAFSLALKRDGTVWGWGDKKILGVGCGSNCLESATTPVQMKAPGGETYLTDATAIASGQWDAVVLKSDGAVLCTYCDAGSGDGYPAQVSGFSGIVAVASGDFHILGLRNDGTVWAWGNNDVGQLGDGTTNEATTAVQVKDSTGNGFLTDIVAIGAGYWHSLAVKADGTVWGWGENSEGEIGGTATNYTLPVQVPNIAGVTTVAGSIYNSIAASNVRVSPPPTGTEYSQTGATRDPVDTLTGAYRYSRTDLAVPGRGPTPQINRAHNSNDTRSGPLGPGWTYNYNVRLNNPGDGPGDLILVTPLGRSDRYTRNQDGSFDPPPSIYTTLAAGADGTFTATHTDQTVWTFGVDGRLSGITDRYGNQSAMSYNAAGQLTSVSDPAGRGSLAFAYSSTDPGSARLITVTDWFSPSRSVNYGYDVSGRLQTVTDTLAQLPQLGVRVSFS